MFICDAHTCICKTVVLTPLGICMMVIIIETFPCSEQDTNGNIEDTGMETESIDDMLELWPTPQLEWTVQELEFAITVQVIINPVLNPGDLIMSQNNLC